MGEIMRAVLEKSSSLSRPVWYGSEVTYQGPNAGISITAPVTVTGSFRVRQNSHFLMSGMSFQLTSYQPSGAFSVINPRTRTGNSFNMGSSLLSLRNLDNNRQYNLPAGLASQQACDFADPIQWESYVYLPPGARMGWTFTDTGDGQGGTTTFNTLTFAFAGIEYFMPQVEDGQAS